MNNIVCYILLAFIIYYFYNNIYNKQTYIQTTVDFFSNSSTPWISKKQLFYINGCRTYDCYLDGVKRMNASSLINDMLIGQPLKYIWKDFNKKELHKYIHALKNSSLKYENSLSNHSILYSETYGDWNGEFAPYAK
jgi:hypothetical protein